MNLKMLLSVYAVFLGVGAAAFTVGPSVVMSVFGNPPLDERETFLAWMASAPLIGLAIICWTTRLAEASKTRDAVILGLTVVSGLFTVLGVLAGIANYGNWVVWAATAVHVSFTVLFIVTGRQAMSARAEGGAAST